MKTGVLKNQSFLSGRAIRSIPPCTRARELAPLQIAIQQRIFCIPEHLSTSPDQRAPISQLYKSLYSNSTII